MWYPTRTFLDKLLLGIIDANLPKQLSPAIRERTRRKRLMDGKRALFGISGSAAKLDDSRALLWMARQWHRDMARDVRTGKRIRQSRPRTVRTLAKEAAKFAEGNSLESIAERLRSQFRDKKKKSYVLWDKFEDDVDATIEEQCLEQIKRLLSSRGIHLDLSGDYSSRTNG